MTEFNPYTYFPDFYTNPALIHLHKNPRWSISTSEKMPVDIDALIHNQGVHGASIVKKPSSTCDIATLHKHLPRAANVAYYLDTDIDDYLIIDIEPQCPDRIKNKLLSIPHFYAETSMSGRGIHLVVPKPPSYADHPSARTKPALKEEHGYFEILQHHWVTFTRNTFPTTLVNPATYQPQPGDLWDQVYDYLAKSVSQTSQPAPHKRVDDEHQFLKKYDGTPAEQLISDIVAVVKTMVYTKTAADFHDDMNRWEFGFISYYNHQIDFVLSKSFPHLRLDRDIREIILFKVIHDIIPHRPKHDEYRNGMPWLLYNINTLLNNYYNQ